jgi:hypothetical protein
MPWRDRLHLLNVYEKVLALRPLDRGNRDFLDVLLDAGHQLATSLAVDGSDATDANVEWVREQVAGQTASNAAERARSIAARLASLDLQVDAGPPLYVRRPMTPLPNVYEAIRIVFGPGLGMGDAITFYPFLRRMLARYQQADVAIWDLYPRLWSHLAPGVRVVHYRRRPLRPFAELVTLVRTARVRTLFVFIDFDCGDFHRRVVPRMANCDVLEIALGRRIAWLARGDSPWIEVDHFGRASVQNHYWMLHELACRLFDQRPNNDAPAWLAFEERSRRPTDARPRVILLNPLSSKSVPFSAEHWSRIFRSIRAKLGDRRSVRIIVYPGVHGQSHADAAAIVGQLRSAALAAELMQHRTASLTAFNAIDAFVDALRECDICITIDTFSAHLAPLFSVPTLVVALKHNPEFWVPEHRTFHWLLENAEAGLPDVAVRLLLGDSHPLRSGRRDAARALCEATMDAHKDPSFSSTLTALYSALATYQGFLEQTPAGCREGAKWMRFWSRVTRGQRQQPVPAEQLMSFVLQWELSGFFKCAALDA